MKPLLQNLGLTDNQAEAYIELLNQGSTSPPKLARLLGITRSNAYKVLDRLVELGLATRAEVAKKLSYTPQDPIALADLLAKERNKLFELEHSVKHSMQQMRDQFRTRSGRSTEVKVFNGTARMKQMYEQQAELSQPIHFISTPADIPMMGHATMDGIRKLAKQHGQLRYGITPDISGSPLNPAIDERSNLQRTWMDANEYTAPVEWSASGDELNIYVFEKAGTGISIKNKAIADAWRQLWRMMDTHMRNDPAYAELPKKAARLV